ncbi:MAG: hypothetical protein LBG58_12970 [Planctomycetaceae bacterium]|jgi:hypothetical protein|nr:hypothetical protein [Planctomycetaceae bacterium]
MSEMFYNEMMFLASCKIPSSYLKLVSAIRKQLIRWYELDESFITTETTSIDFVRKAGFRNFFWFRLLNWNIVDFVQELEDELEIELYRDNDFPDLFSSAFSKKCKKKGVSPTIGYWMESIVSYLMETDALVQ